jgi:hypothetical protein
MKTRIVVDPKLRELQKRKSPDRYAPRLYRKLCNAAPLHCARCRYQKHGGIVP